MSKFIFFRTPKPKGFNYIPLYYNERKERIEQLKKDLEAERSTVNNSNIDELRVQLRSNFKRLRNTRPTPSTGQNIRLILIIVGLIFLFWYLMKPIFS